MKRFERFLAVAGLTLAGLSPPVVAQACFPPDNLDGPCATPTNANLPTFPALSMNGSALAWVDCMPLPKTKLAMTLSAPSQVTCGGYFADFTAIDPITGVTLAAGALELTYSRTWDEADPAGNMHQIWRFLVMSDLVTAPGPAAGAPLPSDDPSFYHGYVDYALACATPPFWEHALVLFHNCDEFLHRPPIAAVPGVFDPTRTFAFVAPDTAANPFDHTAIPPPLAGPVVGGALRDPGPAGALACCTRDRVVQATLDPFVVGCTCPLSFNLPPRNAASRMTAFGACGGGTISFDTNPIGFPWLHLVSTAIGRWTTPFGYPGDEGVLVYEGPLIWQESCSPQRYVELHYGAGTERGWTHGVPLPVPFPFRMLDTRSNWSFPIPGPIGFPLVGMVMPSAFRRHVLFFDLF